MLLTILRNTIGRARQRARSAEDARGALARGSAALRAARFPEAEQEAELALSAGAGHDGVEAEALYLRARARRHRGDLNAALADLVLALERAPRSLAIHVERSTVLHALGRFEEALAAADTALEFDRANAIALNNRGLILREQGRYAHGEADLRRALAARPAYHDARANLALVLVEQGRLDEADAELERVLAAEPQHVEARWNRALVRLLRGDYAAGWDVYESRLARHDALTRPYRYPQWDGLPITDGFLLIYAEQALGDEILFSSCFADAIARAGHCIVECEPRLERLFARSFPRARIVGSKFDAEPRWLADKPSIRSQIAAGSLPRRFRRRIEDFPAHRGYLAADPVRVEAWRARLAGLGREPKIGVAWSGGTARTRRAGRSVRLEQLVPILSARPAHIVSLQYRDVGTEIVDLDQRYHLHVHHWPEAISNYDETAALVTALDLVVSVTTAVVHLAGALGRPAWVLVPANPEWRYRQSGDGMPWYPSVRLFRQPRVGDWETVVQELRDALRASTLPQ
jgi:Tfp pilus assembly protein PilF